jgi:hypothetical protein
MQIYKQYEVKGTAAVGEGHFLLGNPSSNSCSAGLVQMPPSQDCLSAINPTKIKAETLSFHEFFKH